MESIPAKAPLSTDRAVDCDSVRQDSSDEHAEVAAATETIHEIEASKDEDLAFHKPKCLHVRPADPNAFSGPMRMLPLLMVVDWRPLARSQPWWDKSLSGSAGHALPFHSGVQTPNDATGTR